MLPLYNKDLGQPNTSNRSVIIRNASYSITTGINPVVLTPYNEHVASAAEVPLDTSVGWHSGDPLSIQVLTNNAMLATQVAQYNPATGQLRQFANVLSASCDKELRSDLDWALEHNPNCQNASNAKLILAHHLFKTSPANVRLLDMEPIVSLAEALIALNCHVIHYNSFKTSTGAGLDSWHQDDPPPT